LSSVPLAFVCISVTPQKDFGYEFGNGVILRKARTPSVQAHDYLCADRRIFTMGAWSCRLRWIPREKPPVPDKDSSVGAQAFV
jgi:hypothetical protein